MQTPSNDAVYVELSFAPSNRLIPMVRRFVTDFYAELLSEDAASRMGLATHELLENAVKYSTDEKTRLRVEINKADVGRTLTVRTWNVAVPEDCVVLEALVARIKAATDPHDLYQQLMRETPDAPDISGLGLGRIYAEAEMSMECEIDEQVVCVTATTSLA